MNVELTQVFNFNHQRSTLIQGLRPLFEDVARAYQRHFHYIPNRPSPALQDKLGDVLQLGPGHSPCQHLYPTVGADPGAGPL